MFHEIRARVLRRALPCLGLALVLPAGAASAQSYGDRGEPVRIYVDGPAVVYARSARVETTPRGQRGEDGRPPSSFWGDPDPCAPCGAHGPRYASREPYVRPLPAHRAAPRPARYTPPQHVHRAPVRTSAREWRKPGLIGYTAASADRTYSDLERTLDPIVEPALDDVTRAAGTVGGAAIAVALYPPVKILEAIIGAP